MPLTLGSRLGPYEIIAPLGVGGMGEVYRARDPRLGRDIALKVLPQAFVGDPDRLARFEREARILAGISHPNIVVLHSIEHEAAMRFVTMELVEGGTLADLLAPGGLPLQRVLELAIPIGEALAAAHEKGVVHRDLKPANVMVARDGRVKVLDFGLAKLTLERDGDLSGRAATDPMPLSTAGDVHGTPGYMSPEQIRGEAVDARTDLFSFGILLYLLVTGRLPFAGRSVADVTSSILRDQPPALDSLREGLPGELVRLVARCLEKDPGLRVQTALDVVNDLRQLQRQLERGTPDAAMPAQAPTPPVPPRPSPWRGWGVAGVAIVMVAVAIGLGLQRRQAERAAPPAASERRTVAVLEFENLTGDASFDWMRRGVAELLGTALVQSSALDVFDAQRLGELAAGEGDGAARSTSGYAFLAQHGIHRAIAGSVLRSGGELSIQGRIVDTGSGRSVHAYRVAGPADSDMFHLVGRLIPDLQVALEVNLTGDREAEAWLREITTTSADAYRLYLRGHQALLASRWKEAAAAYEEAVALDSTFVAARTELSGAYWNLGDVANLERTRAAMRRLRSRADHRDRLRIDLMDSVVGDDPPGLVRAASQLVQLYPENRFYTYLLGRGYYTTGQYARCLDTLQPLVEQRYQWAWTYVLTARSEQRLGDVSGARRAFELGLEVTHDPELGYAYVRFLREEGEHERVRPVIDEGLRSPILAESPVAEGELRLELAKELNAAGDQAQARAELRRAAALIPPDDEARPEADSLLHHFGMK